KVRRGIRAVAGEEFRATRGGTPEWPATPGRHHFGGDLRLPPGAQPTRRVPAVRARVPHLQARDGTQGLVRRPL
ncbi:hypothetical protein C6P46_006112, partial [Rhodotorula mucilaginosa]